MIRSVLVIGFVALLAIAAFVWALRDEPAPDAEPVALAPEGLTGPDLPVPGALPGSIAFDAPGGRCGHVDLSSLTVDAEAGGAVCSILRETAGSDWPPPERPTLLVGDVLLGASDFARGLRSENAEPILVLGHVERSDGLAAVVVIRRSGALLRALYADAPEIAPVPRGEGFGAAIAMSHGGSLPELVLELWRERTLVDAIPLPTVGYVVQERALGEIVRFSPDGSEVAAAYGGPDGRLAVVDVRSRAVVLGPVEQRGFAWSPDSAWLAVGRPQDIALYGPGRVDPIYSLPLEATALAAWR